MKQKINNGNLTWILLDFDDTICFNTGFPDFVPLELTDSCREFIDKLWSVKLKPVIFTARGWEEHEIVEKFFKEHNIKVHNIICGKPLGLIYIGNEARQFKDNWKELFDEIVNLTNK